MALSLEQDGQELVDDRDSAPSRGGAAGDFSGCVNSRVNKRGWPVFSSPRLYTYLVGPGRLPRIMQT